MHTTQRALLKTIAAASHDDAPRLVYADWLDEYAAELPKKERESTAARAEIIRVQCELALLSDEDSDSRWMYEYLDSQGMYDLKLASFCVDWSTVDAALARRVTLQARQMQLLTAYDGEWRKTEVPEIEGTSFYPPARILDTRFPHAQQARGSPAGSGCQKARGTHSTRSLVHRG